VSEEKLSPSVRRAILFALGGIAVLYLGRAVIQQLRGFIVVVLVSLFLALAIEPAVNALARRGWRRGRATGLVLVGVLVAIAGFLFAVGALLVDQVSTLADRAPEYVDEAIDWINDTFDQRLTADDITARVQEWATGLADDTIALGVGALGALLNLLTIALFTFYLVADGPRLRRAICSALPPRRQLQVLEVWEIAIAKTGGYLYSRFLLAALSTFFTSIALTLIGVASPVALGLWVGLVSQFLPVVGTYLAGVLPIFVALVDDPLTAFWVLVFIVVYQQVENYVFAPRITARTMELHPAVAFGSVLVGAALLGTAGALLALPAAASVQAVIGSSIRRHEVVESDLLPPEADEPGL
jgi:predicted PurR-regulated permease PerM